VSPIEIHRQLIEVCCDDVMRVQHVGKRRVAFENDQSDIRDDDDDDDDRTGRQSGGGGNGVLENEK
jgi:hypothetical protein